MADNSVGVTRFTKSGRPSFVQTLARREFERVLTQFRARWDKDYSDADALASASTRLTERDTAVLQPAEATQAFTAGPATVYVANGRKSGNLTAQGSPPRCYLPVLRPPCVRLPTQGPCLSFEYGLV